MEIFHYKALRFTLIKTFTLLCLILNYTTFYAQNNETNNWYFGQYAGLNFSLPETHQTLSDSNMFAPAGCASISDIDGNLLFYTNSQTIWDKNHNIMSNGDNILGNVGAAQNSIIIPIPNTTDQYYVFTVSASGFYYATVNMSLNNGLGEVTVADVPLLSNSEIGKVSAIHHNDGQSIWVMTTINEGDFSSFYAYKINTDGTINNPVISDNLGFRGRKEGIMKFSPDGNKIAITNIILDEISNHLFVFDFNDETGEVSNRSVLLTSKVFFEVVSAYGIAFSKDSNILYATLRREGMIDQSTGVLADNNTEKKTQLVQYDFETYPNGETPVLSEEIGSTVPGSLQLSKNGKIYRALVASPDIGLNSAGVINNPTNTSESTNYNNTDVNLGENLSRLGLPNFVQSYFRTHIINDSICEGQLVNFEVDTYAEITNAQWSFGDGNTSNEIAPNYTYSTFGPRDVSVTITVNNREITTSRRITVFERPNLISNQELIQCDNDTDGISLFNLRNIREKITDPDLDEELIFYETLNDAELEINPIPNATNFTNSEPNQEIFVSVYNANNCFRITSFIVKAIFVDIIDIPDFHVCEDSDNVIGNSEGTFSTLEVQNEIRNALGISTDTELNLYPTLLDAQTTQNAIRVNLITESTTIWVRAEEADLECSGLAPMNLIVNNIPIINIEDLYTFCQDSPIILNGDPSNDRHEWIDSEGTILSTLLQFSTTTSGSYTHIAYKIENGIECSNSKTFDLIQNEAPIFEDVNVDLDYNNNTISVLVSGNSVYEFSTDNINFYGQSDSYVFYQVPSGEQTIYVRDINQCEDTISKTFQLVGYPKFFTPNNDGINDFWSIKGIEEDTIKSLRIYDRYGKRLITLNPRNGYRWDGLINNTRLATNDYWFRVEYTDGSSKTGHFTLKN